MIGLVWAQASGGVIGLGGEMPWHVPEDMAHFAAVTSGAVVVMGRRTWESLPERFRPLPGRRNIVLSRDADWEGEGAERAASLDEAIDLAAGADVWVIGGGAVYAEAIARAHVIELTELDLAVAGDTVAPPIGDEWRTVSLEPETGWHRSRSDIGYRFTRLERSVD